MPGSRFLLFCSVLFTVFFLSPAGSLAIPALPYPGIHLDKIRMPPGFRISIYAEGIAGARSMTLGAKGTVFVGTRGEGKVYALRDRDGDYRAEEVLTVGRDLRSPNGVAFLEGDLYVAEVGRVLRYDDLESRLDDVPDPVIVNDTFPKDGHHGWKYIAFGPDGKLYVPVGAPCNVCEQKDNRYASIMRMNRDGTGLEIFARGIRNTVGFDWHPESGELWFTNNGRDWMGDEVPPDTLHRAARPGLHFGFPFCHAGRIPDPDFGKAKDCDRFASPAMELGAHVAALGMKFYTGAMFPSEYRGQIFIAEHGSWNRSEPVGYRITRVRLEGNHAKDYRVFAEGWLDGMWAWGRPVDVLLLPDGSMLVSDDRAGAVYRITWDR